MKIVTVVPLQKVAFEEELTYFTVLSVEQNDIVEITLRKRKMLGLVVHVREALEAKMDVKNADFNLRKIEKVKGRSFIPEEFISAALELADYSFLRKNATVAYLLPEVLKSNYDKFSTLLAAREPDEPEPDNLKPEKLLFQASLADRLSHYKTLIRESFAAKKSIFIVLPRDTDIKLFADELGRGIENFVFCLHSSASKKKLEESIEGVLTSQHAVLILGTAQYLSIPRTDIKTVILEKEGSNSYKTVAPPFLDLRTFVEIYATKIKTKFVMSDTLLRFETIGRKEASGMGDLRPVSFRINTDVQIKVIEKGSKATADKKWQPLSDTSLERIKKTLDKNKNVFVYTLRKGLATYTICKHCETPVYCPECQAPLVLYLSKDKKKRMFVCNKCKHEKDPATVCTNCGSWNLVPLGIGTQMVHSELHASFPKTKIFELNKEAVKSKSAALKLIKEFEKSEGSILLGTEMALYYLTQKLPLSVMASFDSLWSIPNYKISERILSLILRTLGHTEQEMLIETKNIHDEAINSVVNGNFGGYVKDELHDREQLGYPPYKRFIKISWADAAGAKKAKAVLPERFAEYEPVIFGKNLLLRLENKSWSLPELEPGGTMDKKLRDKLLTTKKEGFQIQVDPEDVL